MANPVLNSLADYFKQLPGVDFLGNNLQVAPLDQQLNSQGEKIGGGVLVGYPVDQLIDDVLIELDQG